MPATYPLRDIEAVLRHAPDVATGARLLYAVARRHVPGDLPLWRVLDRLRWADDVAGVRASWVHRARTCIPPETSGVYLAIDGPNMPDGKGVELGCSTAHLPGWETIDFVFNCEQTCPDVPLPSLTRLYTHLHREGGYASLGDAVDNMHVEYPVCLGVTALVFRDALRSGMEPFDLVGEAEERCFAIGFTDGDMLRLGRATPSGGFVNDATFDCW